ncbi:MAG: sialidase family protein, partial [Bacteroidota bacterium]
MKKEFLLAILIASVCFMAHSQPSNINVSQGIYFDGEPYLVVNPTNPQNIIVAYMGVTLSPARVSIKTKSSFDGGLTWGNYNVLPHFSYTWGSADVSMAIKNDGTIYLSYIDFRTNPDSGGIYITHSSDGGISWATPSQVWNANTEDIGKDPIDRPWLAVDNSSTATNGTLYMTSKPAYWIPMPNRPYLKTSIDGGQTWTPYRYIDTVNYLVGPYIAQPMSALTTTADGALCIAYPSYETSQSVYGKFFLAKSYSRGATFSYHDLVVNPPTVTDTNFKVGYR